MFFVLFCLFFFFLGGGGGFCLSLLCLLCASFYMCLVVTCWERADLLALVSCV